MAQTTVVKLKVKSLGKYGFFVTDNPRGFNYSQKFAESDKAKVVPGVEFEGEVYTSDAGAQYLNKIVAIAPANVPLAPKEAVKEQEVDKPERKAFKPTYTKKAESSNTMSREDWDSKDRRISRQGCIQVAVQVMGDWDKAVELAEKMLVFVNQK